MCLGKCTELPGSVAAVSRRYSSTVSWKTKNGAGGGGSGALTTGKSAASAAAAIIEKLAAVKGAKTTSSRLFIGVLGLPFRQRRNLAASLVRKREELRSRKNYTGDAYCVIIVTPRASKRLSQAPFALERSCFLLEFMCSTAIFRE